MMFREKMVFAKSYKAQEPTAMGDIFLSISSDWRTTDLEPLVGATTGDVDMYLLRHASFITPGDYSIPSPKSGRETPAPALYPKVAFAQVEWYSSRMAAPLRFSLQYRHNTGQTCSVRSRSQRPLLHNRI